MSVWPWVIGFVVLWAIALGIKLIVDWNASLRRLRSSQLNGLHMYFARGRRPLSQKEIERQKEIKRQLALNLKSELSAIISGHDMPNDGPSIKHRLFHDIYNEYYVRVFFVGWYITESFASAGDIAQETFLALWVHMQSCVDHECFCVGSRKPIAWLATTARHLAYTYRRDYGLEATDGTSESSWENFASLEALREQLDQAFTARQLSQLEGYVVSLPVMYRDVVQDYYLKGVGCKWIAYERDIAVGTVTSQLSRARKMLYKRFVADELDSAS